MEKVVEKVVIIGGGIMGVTLATIIAELTEETKSKVQVIIIEEKKEFGLESSDTFNNAGTGHEGNCEMNYTPYNDGAIDIKKALQVHAEFNIAKQFWAYLEKEKKIDDTSNVIHKVPHISMVNTVENISFLQKRYNEMQKHHFFENMLYSDDINTLNGWEIECITKNQKEKIACTKVDTGTDIDYGALTRSIGKYLKTKKNIEIRTDTKVEDINKKGENIWKIKTSNEPIEAHKVIILSGGTAIKLLKKTGINEARKYAGFPVGGSFLQTEDKKGIHNAKVYGKSAPGSPPMSEPHLDKRIINGKSYLLFGPFPLFNLRLSKEGKISEYFLESINYKDDFFNLGKVGIKNMDLIWYLLTKSIIGTYKKSIKILEDFAPHIQQKDFKWDLIEAGQRVQIIKNGTLQFGTEMVSSEDGSIHALLGASPGASISPKIMIEWVKKYMSKIADEKNNIIKEMFPCSKPKVLIEDKEIYNKITNDVNGILGLTHN